MPSERWKESSNERKKKNPFNKDQVHVVQTARNERKSERKKGKVLE